MVTGGARGIGAAIARRLRSDGVEVVVGDVDQPRPDGSALPLDVTSEKSVEEFLAAVVARHGGLDIVVNNAGIMFEQPVEDHPTVLWDASFVTGQVITVDGGRLSRPPLPAIVDPP